jgi:hypothetical protein
MRGTAVAGQVYAEGAGHYFVPLADGSLAPVSATVAQLLEAEPGAADRPVHGDQPSVGNCCAR